MIKSIDHILIHTPTPEKTLDEIEKVFGIEAYVPLTQYSYFRSAMLCFGNVDIEIVEMGEKKGFEPYFYGVAFEPEKSSWETVDALQTCTIAHTLPVRVHAEANNVSFSWTSISLGGFLDNIIKVPYGTNWMFGNNLYTHMMSRLFSTLMKSDTISKASVKDPGEASLFFCEYHDIAQENRAKVREIFLQNGGTYALTGVEAIMIEKEPNNRSWKKLGAPISKDSAVLAFMESDKNRLNHIRLTSRNSYYDKVIMIGDVKFVIGH